MMNIPNEAFQKIPIIDLVNISNRDSEVRKNLVNEVRNACMMVGFFYAAKEFFALPLDSKMKIENRKSPNFKGYSPLLSGKIDPESAGDLSEGFQLGWEELESMSVSRPTEDGVMAGANVWPSSEEIPGFREKTLKYYHAAVDLGRQMFPLFALALNLPEDFFYNKTQHSAALMKFLHYPPQTGSVDERIIGLGAHTDWECFTILWQEPDIQALQVLNTDKQWINAPPIPGTLVINLGDQLARWTNDIFKSTFHRAVNRSVGVERYSIPLFFGSDYNVKLEPISGCVSPERPLKYEVITAGEYLQSRLTATFNY
ncbi:2OG-Fe(II) oxygenase [Cyathus striatus]|nr:2OG-Fe(II) oxygenase [Cyathus striatus]